MTEHIPGNISIWSTVTGSVSTPSASMTVILCESIEKLYLSNISSAQCFMWEKKQMIYLRWVTASTNDPESMTLSWLGPNDSQLTSFRVPFAKPIDQVGVWCPINTILTFSRFLKFMVSIPRTVHR